MRQKPTISELEAIIGGLCSYPLCDCKSKECQVLDAPIPEVCARSDLIEAEAREVKLREALKLALSAFDNSLRSAGTSTAGFIATRKLMAKAQSAAKAALAPQEAADTVGTGG